MLSSIIILSLHSLLFLTGMVSNISILVMNFLEWMKTRIFSPCALINSSLGLSNVFLQTAMLSNEFSFSLFPKFYSQNVVMNLFLAVLVSLFFSSISLSSCLCFYYFVKILQLTQPVFLWLKANIAAIVPWLLGLSMLASLGVGVPSYWDIYRDTPANTSLSGNGTPILNAHIKSRCQCIFTVYLGLSSVALTVYFFLALSVIISLHKHMCRVRKNSDGCLSMNLDSHMAAAKTLTFLLFLNISFFAALSIIFNISKTLNLWYFPVCLMMVSIFPSINSFILIMGNSKMRNDIKNLLLIKCKH